MYNTKEVVLNVFKTFANEEKAYYLEHIVYKNLDNIILKRNDVSNVWIYSDHGRRSAVITITVIKIYLPISHFPSKSTNESSFHHRTKI